MGINCIVLKEGETNLLKDLNIQYANDLSNDFR